VLAPDRVLAVEPDWYLVVEPRPEPLLAFFPESHDDALHVAFEVGNRHFTLGAAADGALLVPDDPAMAQLAERLGVRWERREAVYTPLGGGSDE
jgi:urease accessory protein UreE